MLATYPTTQQVWAWLATVPDPEIPVVSVTELGIVRDVAYDDDTLVVTVTPTYSGCPATLVINQMIVAQLRAKGIEQLRIERRLSPAWTTDWITDAARDKLTAFGIAPPINGTAANGQSTGRASRLAGGLGPAIACPCCESMNTEKISQFGSTPCKASYRCRDCLEPFDYFKCL